MSCGFVSLDRRAKSTKEFTKEFVAHIQKPINGDLNLINIGKLK